MLNVTLFSVCSPEFFLPLKKLQKKNSKNDLSNACEFLREERNSNLLRASRTDYCNTTANYRRYLIFAKGLTLFYVRRTIRFIYVRYSSIVIRIVSWNLHISVYFRDAGPRGGIRFLFRLHAKPSVAETAKTFRTSMVSGNIRDGRTTLLWILRVYIYSAINFPQDTP